MDTSTPEGRLKRLEQLVNQDIKNGNAVGIVRKIGGSIEDWTDGPVDASERGADNFQ